MVIEVLVEPLLVRGDVGSQGVNAIANPPLHAMQLGAEAILELVELVEEADIHFLVVLAGRFALLFAVPADIGEVLVGDLVGVFVCAEREALVGRGLAAHPLDEATADVDDAHDEGEIGEP